MLTSRKRCAEHRFRVRFSQRSKRTTRPWAVNHEQVLKDQPRFANGLCSWRQTKQRKECAAAPNLLFEFRL